MGNAKYMVTIKHMDDLFPTSYFFFNVELAVQYYNNVSEMHKDEKSYGCEIQLWKLESDPEIVWKLLCTT